MKPRTVKTDCIEFDGYKPCPTHKLNNTLCEDCCEYVPADFRVLILKVGAAGEVLRNTPLLHKIGAECRSQGLHEEITWLTDFPEFVPKSLVHRILKYDWKNVQMLLGEEFDLLLSLDKEGPVCALANQIKAKKKKGFRLDSRGKVVPIDEDAVPKWMTGIFDDLMKENQRHYVEEIFEICGWQWSGEKYIIEDYIIPTPSFEIKDRLLIGLNTGAGRVWPTRIWPESCWSSLILNLMEEKHDVLLLGGLDEDDKNQRLASVTGAHYEGIKPYREFVGLMTYCDLVVTGVTLALHIAVALRKKLVLLNNVFNKNEFFLYGLGSILEPNIHCTACYKQTFDSRCLVSNCMELIKVDQVVSAVEKELLEVKR
jgi:ADP-heptose:LPS heptosyltransferase